MKFQVQFKTPDALHYAITDACGKVELEKREALLDSLNYTANKYVRYGECITVEFDTESQTATVVSKA